MTGSCIETSAIGLQILSGIVVGVSSGFILALAAYARSVWRHRQTVRAFRQRIARAMANSSIVAAQKAYDSGSDAAKNSLLHITPEAIQYKMFEIECESLRVMLAHQGDRLHHHEREAIDEWLNSTRRFMDLAERASTPPDPSLYDDFWATLGEKGWLDG